MKLYIVQHGQAVTKQEDPQRPLSRQGIEDVTRLAEMLKQKNIQPQHIFHSGKARAEQTANIIATALDKLPLLEKIDGISPMDDARTFIERLQSISGDVLIASHMPFVNNVAQALLGEAGLQSFDFEPGKLIAIQLKNGGAELSWHS